MNVNMLYEYTNALHYDRPFGICKYVGYALPVFV